ncbi:MAG: GTPase Era [Alphaproteobacteria bacterium]|nr:GTPase Era [Alphaproteobacteria bacterium]MBQ3945998.1 GTPase Era [Alphaproteobacteria bacterium]
MQSETECAFVAIVGEPNAGKSTLVNSIVGKKVSIVSPKVQTTRRQVRGITEVGNTQLVFVDTPGFCKPNTSLEKAIEHNFKNSYQDADIILLVIDATSKSIEPSLKFLSKVPKETTISVVINKVDIAKKENILKIAKRISEYDFVAKTFMISASKLDGVQDIVQFLTNSARPSPWFFEPNTTTDLPMSQRLAEITREKLFSHLDKELPYSVYVETELVHETDKKAKIIQSIVVIKPSQKGIVLGKSGGMIRKLKYEAIKDMRNLLNKKIELKLFVKVKEKWVEKKVHLKNAGIID